MKKRIWKKGLAVLLLLCMLLSLTACGSSSSLPAKKAETADLMVSIKGESVSGLTPDKAFRTAFYGFAAGLLTECYDMESNKNVLLSPLSVMTALAMTANGAKGETLSEMEAALLGDGASLKLEDLNRYLYEYYRKLPSSEKSRFTFANSIWFKDEEGFSVEEAFLKTNKSYYGPDIYKSPFDETTVRDINQWVDQKTEHLIPQVMKELTPSDMMALINALLFDAQWEQPFGSDMVTDGRFTALDGSQRIVSMMSGESFYVIEEGDVIGFMKSYAGDQYRFVALLPREETADFTRFVDSLNGEGLEKLLANVKNRSISIQMPKFTTEYNTDLVKALGNMGIKKALGGQADFSGISKTTELSIGQVIHKTRLELDNNGTKAAAVTVVMATKAAMMRPDQLQFIALNRPFVYMIVDTENMLPIFLGTAADVRR